MTFRCLHGGFELNTPSLRLTTRRHLSLLFVWSFRSSTAGSDDADTDWDLELGLVGPGTGRTGEPSPNNARDVKRANIAEGLKALLRGAPQGGKHQS